MGMTDPIADMLTRIRNGNRVHFKSVDVLSSRINLNMAKVLKKSGYIGGYDIKKDQHGHEVLRDLSEISGYKAHDHNGYSKGSANPAEGSMSKAKGFPRSWTVMGSLSCPRQGES